MFSNRLRFWILFGAAVLVGVVVLWRANAALGQGPVSPQLSYQGTLFESGEPVTGARDMVFRLYSDDVCSTQLGPDIVRNGVAVEDGFFTVYLGVDPVFFDGHPLWIQADVGGTTFDCQAILPAAYALTLRPGAVIRGSTSSAHGLLEFDNTGPGQAIRVTSTGGAALYGTTTGGPAVYGYASGYYGLYGVSSASGFAAVRGDTSTADTWGGDFYSAQSSGVSGVTDSIVATPIPGNSDSYVAGARGVGESGGMVYGVYAETRGGTGRAGLYATNLGGGQFAPDVELGARSSGTGADNGVLASDQNRTSSNLVLRSNDDIWLYLDADQSFETSNFEVRDRLGATLFNLDDLGNTVVQGTVTGEAGLRTGTTTEDGVYVHQAGAYPSSGTSGSANGVEVRSTSNDGLMVGANGGDGVDIWNAGQHGLYVRNAGQHGLYIQNVVTNGIDIDNVGAYGIHISDAGADNYFAGDTGIGTDTPGNRLEVRESISGAAAPSNHVVQIYNTSSGGSADVLALRINEAANDIDGANNYISFQDAAAQSSLGSIQGNGSGGVVLAGPGSDYAEYLPRLNPEEDIRPGDVVGIFGGRVSRRTERADQIMVASTGAIVSGNDPGEEKRHNHSLIAFVGQVHVRVRGPVAAGDLIVPSGLNDGTAVAVSAEAIGIDQLDQVIGQAWEGNADTRVKQVRTLVGLVQPRAFSAALQDVDARLDALEQALDASAAAAAGGQ